MSSPTQEPSLAVARLVWLAFMAAILFYAVIAFVVFEPTRSANASLTWILLIFALISAASLAGVFAFPRPLIRQAETYFTACMIRWAMLEAIGVYGVLARILGAAPTHCAMFLGVSLVGLSLVGPSEDGRRQFQEQRRP
jgi:tellurite resistance protein TehA-like permease